jgi:phage N-6-adenine-methyltransferase
MTKARDEWKTPPYLFQIWHIRYEFTIDVCATKHNAKMPRYFSRRQNGLLQSWQHERVWCNPPYSNILPWVEKAPTADLAVLLVPPRTDQAWWHLALNTGAKIGFLQGRIKFLPPLGVKESSPRDPSCLLVWGGSYSSSHPRIWSEWVGTNMM